MNIECLEATWWVLSSFLFVIYVLLEGRATASEFFSLDALETIGPVYQGNEAEMIVFGMALFCPSMWVIAALALLCRLLMGHVLGFYKRFLIHFSYYEEILGASKKENTMLCMT